ncbi:MAG: hypothetical protein HS116_25015 [Planctomycetes bacterium]|nr:hypothetical protein [Planctomycetota bacterium]
MPKDLIAALSKRPKAGKQEGLTVSELCSEMGCNERAVRMRLRALASEGRIEVVKRKIFNLAGQAGVIPAYRLLPKEPARK